MGLSLDSCASIPRISNRNPLGIDIKRTKFGFMCKYSKNLKQKSTKGDINGTI